MKNKLLGTFALLTLCACGKCPPEDSLMAQKHFDQQWQEFVQREVPRSHAAYISGIMPADKTTE